MSTSEREACSQDDSRSVKVKRRRLQGACDSCRQRKIRCDSAERHGQKCTNCVAFSSECTRIFATQRKDNGSKTLPLPSALSDPVSLGQLRERMDPLLKSVLSGSYQTPVNPVFVRETIVALARYARALEAGLSAQTFATHEAVLPPTPPPPAPSGKANPWVYSFLLNMDVERPANPSSTQKRTSDETVREEPEIATLTDTLRRALTLRSTGAENRFFGLSSNIALLDTTSRVLREASNGSMTQTQQPKNLFANLRIRPEFWTVHPWEKVPASDYHSFDFPPPDLLRHLVALYFSRVNIYVPLLHRPTFEKGIAIGLHLSDPGFASAVLGVCAVASRFSNDDRVLLDGFPSRHSSGYKWFRQLKLFRESNLRAPSVHDVQALCLATIYLQGSSTPEQCWYVIGLGIRAAQDAGFNRKDPSGPPTIEGELRKRAFWVLFIAESVVSAAVGRPPSVSDSDFDLEMPIECDDEYWEHSDPQQAFKQPPGIPSSVSLFCTSIKLLRIQHTSQKAFYSVRRPDPPLGISSKEWDRITLANLDSELNSWVDSVPEHLRWDPDNISYSRFFDQSAMLFSMYYHLQIFLHRPFVGCTDDPGLAFSSLAICTNAARACVRILDTHAQRGFIPTPQNQMALFNSALMLTLHIWRARLAGSPLPEEARELKAVHSCINILQSYEDRWHGAGRFRDILTAMASVGGLEAEPPSRPAKRSHSSLEGDTDQPFDANLGSSFTRHGSSFVTERRSSNDVVQDGTNLGAAAQPINFGQQSGGIPGVDAPFELPFYSEELSRPFTMDGNPSLDIPVDNVKDLADLEAMWNQIQAMNANTVSANDLERSPSGSDLSHPSPSLALIRPETAIDFGGTNSNPLGPCATGDPLGNQPYFEHLQGAAMWTTVPVGYDLDDWQQYISSVGTLNAQQNPTFPPTPT